MYGGDGTKMIGADPKMGADAHASAIDGAAGDRVPSQDAQDVERTMRGTGEFFFERAEKEHESAERKREATMTKAAAIASLAAALTAIIAAPAFDVADLSSGASRWVLLGAIVAFLGAIGCMARVMLIQVTPGERVSRRELENWTSEDFWATDVVVHSLDLTRAFVRATQGIRSANERAETWMAWGSAGVGTGLLLLLIAFVLEMT